MVYNKPLKPLRDYSVLTDYENIDDMINPQFAYVLEQGDNSPPNVTLPVIWATQGVISSRGNHHTSIAGMKMRLNSGNVFDVSATASYTTGW